MGRQFKQRFHIHDHTEEEPDPVYTPPPHGTCRVQVVRSVSDWSHGVLKENSIQNACSSLLPRILTRALTAWFCQTVNLSKRRTITSTSVRHTSVTTLKDD